MPISSSATPTISAMPPTVGWRTACARWCAKVTVMTMPGIKQVIKPDPALREAYTQQYARYRALYPAIEEARK